MHPILSLFASLSTSISSSSTSSSGFWYELDNVKALSDPPSTSFLKRIQEEPWRGGLEPIPLEGIPLHKAQLERGKIPSDLHGVLCRNGPGRIRIGDTQYGHWFDSDGVVSQLCLDGTTQTATFMAKYVETERFKAQKKVPQRTGNVPMATAGAWTKRGLGRWWENLFSIPTNPSNTNVIFLEDGDNIDGKTVRNVRLFALAEGGDPVEMDPTTLATFEAKPFGNAKGEAAKSFFSAHYKKDPVTGTIYNHGSVLIPNPGVNVMKFSGSGELLAQKSTELRDLGFIHDNLVSENYFVAIVQPYIAPTSALMTSVLGGEPLGQQFEWKLGGMSDVIAMVFSKDTLECVSEVPLPLLSTYHLIDAFEDEKNPNLLTFRTLVHDPPDSRSMVESGFKDMYKSSKIPLCSIMEYTLDLEAKKMRSNRRVAPQAGLFELPDVNAAWGYRKRYLWTNTREEKSSFLNSLQKVDMDTGKCSNMISFGPKTFAGAPIFVAKKEAKKEDDGYILTQLYRSDEHRSDVSILDAASMEELALLRLEGHITYQFHGAWQSR